MSIYVLTEVFDRSTARGTDRLVLIGYADSADRETGEARVGMQQVADIAGVSISTARRSTQRLVEKSQLVVVDPGGGRGNIPVYRVNVGRYRTEHEPSLDGKTLNLTPFPEGESLSKGSQNPSASDTLSEPRTYLSDIAHTPGARGPGLRASEPAPPESPKPYHVAWAIAAVDVWIELKGGAVTKSTKSRWVDKAKEFFLAIDAELPDDFLTRAHREGIREPSAWDSFMRDVYAPSRAPVAADVQTTPDWLLERHENTEPVDPSEIAPEFRRFLDRKEPTDG